MTRTARSGLASQARIAAIVETVRQAATLRERNRRPDPIDLRRLAHLLPARRRTFAISMLDEKVALLSCASCASGRAR